MEKRLAKELDDLQFDNIIHIKKYLQKLLDFINFLKIKKNLAELKRVQSYLESWLSANRFKFNTDSDYLKKMKFNNFKKSLRHLISICGK